MKKTSSTFVVQIAGAEHLKFAEDLCKLYEDSAKKRGTGIAKRDPEYIKEKILQEKGIIAITAEKHNAGFWYIKKLERENYVGKFGLIFKEEIRNHGIVKKIKKIYF